MRNKSKKDQIIKKIDSTRDRLHKAIERGNDEEIMRLSCKLDSLIVDYIINVQYIENVDNCAKNKDNPSLQSSLGRVNVQRKIIFGANDNKI